MNKSKPLQEGIRDNLYGIPLNDILTPEEIADLEKERSKAVYEKRKKKKKESKFKINFHFDKKLYLAAGCILAAVVVLVLVKNPMFARIASKIYVSEAIEKTIELAVDERADVSKFLFGFDVCDTKNASVELNALVNEDSYQNLSGVESSLKTDVSFKGSQAIATWDLKKDGENILNVSGYLNEEESGINFGNFFSEYWIFPAKDFGEKWNKSGLKGVLYAQQTNQNCDISFSNVFSTGLVSEQSKKAILKLADTLFVSAKTKYMGKQDVRSGDKKIKARKIEFKFSSDKVEEYLTAIADIVLNDVKFKSIPDIKFRGDVVKRFKPILERIYNNITFDRDISLYFYEYKGRIVRISTNAQYTENMHDTTFLLDLITADKDNIFSSIEISAECINGIDDYSFKLVSSGNRGTKDKVFADKTEICEITPNYTRDMYNEIKVDMKNKTIVGSAVKTEGEISSNVSYSGTLSRKKGLDVSLDNLNFQLAGKGQTRNVKSNLNLCISPNTVNKISVGSKRAMLELDRSQAESYINKIIETDNFKKVDDSLKEIFGR